MANYQHNPFAISMQDRHFGGVKLPGCSYFFRPTIMLEVPKCKPYD